MSEIKNTVSSGPTPVLTDYDVILINTSGGKDSQVALDVVVKIAKRAGVLDRLVAVHCDLGEMEWEGTAELAEEQVRHYGIRFEVVSRPQGDLLQQIQNRAITIAVKAEEEDDPSILATPVFPSSSARYCTSDQKTGQVRKLVTQLKNEQVAAGVTDRPVRILNILGLRAQESTERAKKVVYRFRPDFSNGLVQTDEWLPIHNYTEQLVWATIKASGVRYHQAYDLGMSRLSCVFCIMGSKEDLQIAARHNPALLRKYAQAEQDIEDLGLTRPNFTSACSLRELEAKLQAA